MQVYGKIEGIALEVLKVIIMDSVFYYYVCGRFLCGKRYCTIQIICVICIDLKVRKENNCLEAQYFLVLDSKRGFGKTH